VKDLRPFVKPEGFRLSRDSQRPYSAVKPKQGLEMMTRVVESRNPHVQSAKMLAKIVDYAVAKHAVDTVGPLESEIKLVQ
jgi:hypothetical protein